MSRDVKFGIVIVLLLAALLASRRISATGTTRKAWRLPS